MLFRSSSRLTSSHTRPLPPSLLPSVQLDLATPLLKAGCAIDVPDHALKGATAEELFASRNLGSAFDPPLSLRAWTRMLRGE